MNVHDEPAHPEGTFEELTAFLLNHAEVAAERARAKLGGPLTVDNLGRFMDDPDCLRYPTTIAFEAEGVDPNQFAEPIFRETDGKPACVLHVHPRFAQHPDALPLFVAYMAAVINYGQVVSPDVCERYGADLVGMPVDDYYQALCNYTDGS